MNYIISDKELRDLIGFKPNYNKILIDFHKSKKPVKYLTRTQLEQIITPEIYDTDRLDKNWHEIRDKIIDDILELALPSEEVKEMKGLEKIKELIKIQKESAKDDYMVGLYNGLELARATLENNDPNYMDCFNTKENISK